MHASLQNSAQLTHHLSADARRLLALAQPVGRKSRAFAPQQLQADFFRKKLCPANLYPLLWATET